MALTINELYQAAAIGETSWEYALLLTGLLYIDEAGLAVSPPPSSKIDYHFYKTRLDALSEHPSNNNNYKNVIKELQSYISSFM